MRSEYADIKVWLEDERGQIWMKVEIDGYDNRTVYLTDLHNDIDLHKVPRRVILDKYFEVLGRSDKHMWDIVHIDTEGWL